MQLSPRLKAVANMISPCNRLIDIGTDHCYIPIKLLRDNKVQFCIVSDINEGPLEVAQQAIEQYGLKEKVSLRLGDGFSILSNEEVVDVAIIAGMGGETICSILSQKPNWFKVRF